MPLPAPPHRDRLTGGAHGRSHRSLEAGSGISYLDPLLGPARTPAEAAADAATAEAHRATADAIAALAARATHPGPTTLDDGGARATADVAALGIGYILVTPDGPRSILLGPGSKEG